MQNVLRGLQWEECLLYMGDVIVRGASFQESLLRMEYNINKESKSCPRPKTEKSMC
jgi:hypothetical protein